jgi:uncharacterized protein YwqG
MPEELFIPLSLAKFAPEILASIKTTIKIVPTISQDDLPIRQSKFLGIPYWSQSIKNYPKDKQGNLMKMIAQINFEEVNKFNDGLDYFPKKGILQFFLPEYNNQNRSFGISFEPSGKTSQDVAVVYHDNTNLPQLLNSDIQKINQLNNVHNFPIFKHSRLKFFKDYKFCPLLDYYSSSYYYEKFIDNISNNEREEFNSSEEFNSTGCKIDGYPFFNQSDPRLDKYDIDNPWILLLQLDSISDEHGEHISMWGNSGVANWFIKKQDLINKYFSKTLYYWDCK